MAGGLVNPLAAKKRQRVRACRDVGDKRMEEHADPLSWTDPHGPPFEQGDADPPVP